MRETEQQCKSERDRKQRHQCISSGSPKVFCDLFNVVSVYTIISIGINFAEILAILLNILKDWVKADKMKHIKEDNVGTLQHRNN